ncbi:MAG: hypothetical protein IPN88_11775 [Bacteroidetes bacterium]|nr:hypothetical protein [Bacteroidota bacterium]
MVPVVMTESMKRKELIIRMHMFAGLRTETCKAFVELLYKGKLNAAGLITHEYPFTKAEDAYRSSLKRLNLFIWEWF